MDLRRDRARNCFCCVLMLFVNMGVLSTSFSAYFPYIRELKGFSNTQVFLLTTMRQIFAMIVMTRSDSFYGRLDIRKGTVLTFLLSALSFGILAFTPDSRLYFLATALFGVSYGLGGMIPASILLRRWYTDQSGTAIGIAAAGSGIAGMVIPLQVTRLVEGYGLSTAFAVQGAAILVLTVPLVLFVKDHPEAGETALRQDTGTARTEKAPEAKTAMEAVPEPGAGTARMENAAVSETEKGGPGTERRQEVQKKTSAGERAAFRPAEHPRLIAGMILMGLLSYQSPAGFSMLFRTSGYEMEKVAFLLSAMGFFLIPGKILVGKFADRFGGKRMFRDCTLLVSVTLFLFSQAAFLPFLLLLFLLMVFALGISESTVGISVIAGDYAPAGTYAQALKSCQFFYALGGLLFSTTNGVVADLTGSYAPAYAFYGAAALAMMAVLLPGYPKTGNTA